MGNTSSDGALSIYICVLVFEHSSLTPQTQNPEPQIFSSLHPEFRLSFFRLRGFLSLPNPGLVRLLNGARTDEVTSDASSRKNELSHGSITSLMGGCALQAT